VLHERESVVENWEVRTQVKELLVESANVGGGVKVVQRIPVILTSKSGPLERGVEKDVRTEAVATMTLPSLVGRHSLTAEEIIAIGVVE
jgi:hypothetical protein